MIGVFLDGRMGNHMFQYAFALSASKEQHTLFFVDQLKLDFILSKYFELKSYSNTKNSVLSKLYHTLLRFFFDQEVETSQVIQPKKFTYYIGFFQSYSFFINHETLIRENFTIKTAYRHIFEEYRSKHPKIINDYLVIHVRLTDYQNISGDDITLPIQYYQLAFQKLPKPIEELPVIVCSDDINHAKLLFSKYERFEYSQGSMIDDFQWILNAQYAIISNSSFAWWAAFLNEHNGKYIIAPKYWMGYHKGVEYPPNISKHLEWLWL